MAKGDESQLRDRMFAELHDYFSSKFGVTGKNQTREFQVTAFERHFLVEKEGKLAYGVGSGESLSHKSDLLLSILSQKIRFAPLLNVELKFRSSVTDAFKARAYDQMHLKQAYQQLLGLLVYVRPARGLSFDQVKRIGYTFDSFLFLREGEISRPQAWARLVEAFEKRMQSVSEEYPISDVRIREVKE